MKRFLIGGFLAFSLFSGGVVHAQVSNPPDNTTLVIELQKEIQALIQQLVQMLQSEYNSQQAPILMGAPTTPITSDISPEDQFGFTVYQADPTEKYVSKIQDNTIVINRQINLDIKSPLSAKTDLVNVEVSPLDGLNELQSGRYIHSGTFPLASNHHIYFKVITPGTYYFRFTVPGTDLVQTLTLTAIDDQG